MQQRSSTTSNGPLTYAQILKFYLPLATASALMIGSMNVVNSALSRTPNPEGAIAAYAIGLSLCDMMASPCFSGMNMLITLGRDRVYFNNGLRFMFKIMLASLVAIGALAFTPFGRFVSVGMCGATSDMFAEIQNVFRWALLLPIIFTSMAYSRSILLVERQTHYVTIARTVRIIVMFAVAAFLPESGLVQGATIGILIVLSGMTTETILNVVPAIMLLRRWPHNPQEANVPEKNYPPTQKAAFHFVWPLMITSLMWAVRRPLLNAGLARTASPELTIATYQVAANFTWLFMVFVEDNVKQVTIAFTQTNNGSGAKIKKFTTVVSVLVAVTIAITALTPFSNYVLGHIIGASDTIVANSLAPILILSLYPFIMVIQERLQAFLLLAGKTKPLGMAKVVNVLATGVAVFSLALLMPQLGPAIGALALSTGMLCEMLTMRYFAHKHEQQTQTNAIEASA